MSAVLTNYRFFLLPDLHSSVWILATGRFLSAIGTGFTLFYAPIFFVNQVGLSTTAVGFALGSASLSGIIGRILGGSFADSPQVGRRYTLLLSAAISAIGSLILAATHDFATLVFGNLMNGFGVGLYWPATEAVVADVTATKHLREAFALTRLADNLGLGVGVAIAGFWVATTGNYRTLFIVDGISFIIFFVVIYVAIRETLQPQQTQQSTTSHLKSWATALRDRRLLVYIAVNVIFTTYISQLHSTLPVYFKNFVPVNNTETGFSEAVISVLFTWHLVIAIVGQLPVIGALKRYSHAQALIISAVMWAIGFSLIWLTNIVPSNHLIWSGLALAIFAIAIVSYTASAASLVTDLAPVSQRGVYFAVNALCWSVGYSIGPPLGGWALDQTQLLVNDFWLGLAGSAVLPIIILHYLNGLIRNEPSQP